MKFYCADWQLNLEEDKKEYLVQNIRDNLNVTDVTSFNVTRIMGDTALTNRVVVELFDYLKTEMSLIVIDH